MSEVIIDGCNTLKERKFIIHTDKYSIGEDGLIDKKIPFADICYDLALQLQRAKAELEELKKYKRYKFLFEKAKEMKEQTDKWAKECLKENEDLKDSLKRTVCQAECFRYKETEKYKAENERLKAENEKLKKALEDIRKELLEKSSGNSMEKRNSLAIIDEVLNANNI